MNRNLYGYIVVMIGWFSGLIAFTGESTWQPILGILLLTIGYTYMIFKHSDDPKCVKCTKDDGVKGC